MDGIECVLEDRHTRRWQRLIWRLVGRLHLVRLHDDRGSALIEMSFVIVFLLMFLAGIVDFGSAFQHQIILLNAAREGARTYARSPCRDNNRSGLRSAILAAVQRESSESNVTIDTEAITIAPDPATGCPAAGTPVTVRIQLMLPTILGGFIDREEIQVGAGAVMEFYGTD